MAKKKPATNVKELRDYERKYYKEVIKHMDTRVTAAQYLSTVAELQLQAALSAKNAAEQKLKQSQEKLNGTG